MYHGVTRKRYSSCYWLLVHEPEFMRQMEHLTRYFNVIPGSRLVDQQPLEPRSTVITFDDGMSSVAEVAAPIMRKLKLPSVCFAVPALSEMQVEISSGNIFDSIVRTKATTLDLTPYGLGKFDIPGDEDERSTIGIAINRELKSRPEGSTAPVVEAIRLQIGSTERADTSPFRLMTKAQLQKLAADPLFEIGGHTNYHITLSSVSDEKQKEEIRSCIDKLTGWGIEPISLFCYPSGRFNAATKTILEQAGIKAAVATTDGLQDRIGDPFEMKRISVGIDTGIYEFKARMSGLYYALMGETK